MAIMYEKRTTLLELKEAAEKANHLLSITNKALVFFTANPELSSYSPSSIYEPGERWLVLRHPNWQAAPSVILVKLDSTHIPIIVEPYYDNAGNPIRES